jgi:hypothetical protein
MEWLEIGFSIMVQTSDTCYPVLLLGDAKTKSAYSVSFWDCKMLSCEFVFKVHVEDLGVTEYCEVINFKVVVVVFYWLYVLNFLLILTSE